MKAAVLGRSATYRDLCAVPDNLVAEILDGDLWTSPRPAPRHSHVLAALMMTLGPPFQHGNGGPGGWHFLPEIELHFHGDVLVPDLAGWRLNRHLDLLARSHITASPDWVCEVISKSTEDIDRSLKMKIYARERVGYLWFIDPRKQSVEVFKQCDRTWVPIQTFAGGEVAPADPFSAVPLPLSRLWAESAGSE